MNFVRRMIVALAVVLFSFNKGFCMEEHELFDACHSQKTILVVGGAGYIGSHTSFALASKGYHVVVLDNLWYGHTFNHSWAELIVGDCGDEAVLDQVFAEHKIDAVMHFSAFIEVGESVKKPEKYYANNVVNTIKLLNAMVKAGVKKIIFSSSAAVYGMPNHVPIEESQLRKPINPYGNTKLIMELLLEDYGKAHGIGFVGLRFFNVAGAYPEKGLGERHNPESHVVPLMLRAAINHKPFNVFGDDYATPDGSCIRDYLHVRDIAQAHVCAFEYLSNGGASDFFNLGTGTGFSVKELVNTVERVTGQKLQTIISDRRAGDPAILVADAHKAHNILGWQPQHSNLAEMISSAYQFEQQRI